MKHLRAWHLVIATIAIYAIAGGLIHEIWLIDPWLFAALAFGGVLAL